MYAGRQSPLPDAPRCQPKFPKLLRGKICFPKNLELHHIREMLPTVTQGLAASHVLVNGIERSFHLRSATSKHLDFSGVAMRGGRWWTLITSSMLHGGA